MASRNTQRRRAKAIRRKNQLAERRRLGAADASGALAQRVRRAKAAPLRSCLVQEGLFEHGAGMVVLTRKIGANRFALAGFLLDVFCLGVKDATFREADEEDLETFLTMAEAAAPFEPVDPAYARKLVREAAAYARSLGLPLPADYAAVEPFFGDADADACDVRFEFGHEGRPLYIPGPSDSATDVRRTLDLLHRRLGADGFDFDEDSDEDEIEDEDEIDILEEPDADIEDEDLEDEPDVFEKPDDEDDDIEGAYDPDVAPDPAEWLALDEMERMLRVEDYHRRAGVSLPNENLHATIHAVVENQIAMGDELPVRRAIDRLMAEGLDRHEAIHAVGSVLTDHLHQALKDPAAKAVPQEAYNAAIERITAESWRRYWEEEEDEEE